MSLLVSNDRYTLKRETHQNYTITFQDKTLTFSPPHSIEDVIVIGDVVILWGGFGLTFFYPSSPIEIFSRVFDKKIDKVSCHENRVIICFFDTCTNMRLPQRYKHNSTESILEE